MHVIIFIYSWKLRKKKDRTKTIQHVEETHKAADISQHFNLCTPSWRRTQEGRKEARHTGCVVISVIRQNITVWETQASSHVPIKGMWNKVKMGAEQFGKWFILSQRICGDNSYQKKLWHEKKFTWKVMTYFPADVCMRLSVWVRVGACERCFIMMTTVLLLLLTGKLRL